MEQKDNLEELVDKQFAFNDLAKNLLKLCIVTIIILMIVFSVSCV